MYGLYKKKLLKMKFRIQMQSHSASQLTPQCCGSVGQKEKFRIGCSGAYIQHIHH